MTIVGLVPALGFLLLRVTGLADSLHALTSVGFEAAGGPGPGDVALAALTELCWLGWKVLTPACGIAAALLALATWRQRSISVGLSPKAGLRG
jgi:hypothetical protein